MGGHTTGSGHDRWKSLPWKPVDGAKVVVQAGILMPCCTLMQGHRPGGGCHVATPAALSSERMKLRRRHRLASRSHITPERPTAHLALFAQLLDRLLVGFQLLQAGQAVVQPLIPKAEQVLGSSA